MLAPHFKVRSETRRALMHAWNAPVALTKSPTGALMWLHATEAKHTNAAFSESR